MNDTTPVNSSDWSNEAATETSGKTRLCGLLFGTPFAALALFIASFILLLGFNIAQLYSDSGRIETAATGLESQEKQAKQVREQLDAITAGLLELSTQGNQNAAMVIADLQRRGVAIELNKSTSEALTTAPKVAAE